MNFFRFPLELRDLIYDAVLSDTRGFVHCFRGYRIQISHQIPIELTTINRQMYRELDNVSRRRATMVVSASERFSTEDLIKWYNWERACNIPFIEIKLHCGSRLDERSYLCKLFYRDLQAMQFCLFRMPQLRTFRFTIYSCLAYEDLKSAISVLPSVTVLRDVPFDRWYDESRVEARIGLHIDGRTKFLQGTISTRGLPRPSATDTTSTRMT